MSLKFIAGLAVGAVIVHFLNTEEGKAFLCRFKKDINKAEEEITGLAEGLVQKGKDLINGREEMEEETAPPLIVVVESNPVV
jgi:bifunctional DNA-binding transcriptional regulator/antitoxin component of YhaV-PrlF toxin-antitoxin module